MVLPDAAEVHFARGSPGRRSCGRPKSCCRRRQGDDNPIARGRTRLTRNIFFTARILLWLCRRLSRGGTRKRRSASGSLTVRALQVFEPSFAARVDRDWSLGFKESWSSRSASAYWGPLRTAVLQAALVVLHIQVDQMWDSPIRARHGALPASPACSHEFGPRVVPGQRLSRRDHQQSANHQELLLWSSLTFH